MWQWKGWTDAEREKLGAADTTVTPLHTEAQGAGRGAHGGPCRGDGPVPKPGRVTAARSLCKPRLSEPCTLGRRKLWPPSHTSGEPRKISTGKHSFLSNSEQNWLWGSNKTFLPSPGGALKPSRHPKALGPTPTDTGPGKRRLGSSSEGRAPRPASWRAGARLPYRGRPTGASPARGGFLSVCSALGAPPLPFSSE